MKPPEPFRPDPALKSLYYAYLAIGIAVGGLSWMLPVALAGFTMLPFEQASLIAACLFLPALVILLITSWWIPRYYASISYQLGNQEIVIERGVYWKHRHFVPYNRVTNIDLMQGPLSRAYGLGTVRVQTAGYSSASSGTSHAEAVILGVRNFEALKDVILTEVRRLRPIGVEAGAEMTAPREMSEAILAELRRIREALEEK